MRTVLRKSKNRVEQKERLQKILSNSGIASRRRAERFIEEGRVSVNGVVVKQLGAKAYPFSDVIEVDGVQVDLPENKVYLMLNKPGGYITSCDDPQGRETVLCLTTGIQERIFPVGRLDYDTEGLLVMTNDGKFAQKLQHPSSNIKRVYLVKIQGHPSRQAIDQLKNGVFVDGEKTNRAAVKLLKKTDRSAWVEVCLREGRNRQIKKMFEAVRHRVQRIIRTDFGPLQLQDLPVGAYRFLKKSEIEAIKNL